VDSQITNLVDIKLTCIVYLHCANVFQSLMLLSLLPDTICLLSAENATLNTSCKTKKY